MQSMRERAELSGGSYAVSSALGQGTKVCVWWPAFKASDANRNQARCAVCGRQSSVIVDGVEVRGCYCTDGAGGAQLNSKA